ncbi:hypothetical protein [Flammeovirga kamogawensis]|uniref:DUF4252 domain-containing protein n=1 Tax=Flammeovirga kamogawensis TaxID=373891 RepID=A0ABX8GW09_9BACT|nr:hypothetical protein [Flammeovirga kamogawensis]MBB6461224.1 hypothetical protein [Flammeovirga kamogawensis]QWG07785.1 hypothetical protein KM029_02260 [Flammeovirga kamogawensis]TRX69591.1 hypothetical protein EO216_16195 [Flammeovirga kamogawensis]
MKSKLFYTIALMCSLLLFNLSAQSQTKKEKKATLKQLKTKAVKDAKKQAKTLSKQGYTEIPGDLPMAMQLENSYYARLAQDDMGNPKFFVVFQESKGESFAAAKQSAYQLCLNELATQIGSEIIGRIKTNLSNSESLNDSGSVNEVIGSYQNNVSARLGRTTPIVLLKKVDGGMTYITMSVKYPISEAERIVKEDLRKELAKKSDLQQDEIDGLLDIR